MGSSTNKKHYQRSFTAFPASEDKTSNNNPLLKRRYAVARPVDPEKLKEGDRWKNTKRRPFGSNGCHIFDLPPLCLRLIADWLTLEERNHFRASCRAFYVVDRHAWLCKKSFNVIRDCRFLLPGKGSYQEGSLALFEKEFMEIFRRCYPTAFRRVSFRNSMDAAAETEASAMILSTESIERCIWANMSDPLCFLGVTELNLENCVFENPELELLSLIFPNVERLSLTENYVFIQHGDSESNQSLLSRRLMHYRKSGGQLNSRRSGLLACCLHLFRKLEYFTLCMR